MAARNIVRTHPFDWTYHSPASASASQQNRWTEEVYRNGQSGAFGARPKPLPATTPYSSVELRVTPGTYDLERYWSGGSDAYRKLPTLRLATLDESHDESKYNAAVAALNSTIRNGTWESGVFLAELKQTTRLFIESTLSIAKFLGSIKKTRKGKLRATWKGVTKVANNLGGLWLLFRYGITPLYYDMRDSMDLLKNKVNVFDRRCHCKTNKVTATQMSTTKLPMGSVELIAQTKLWFKAWFQPEPGYYALMQRLRDQFGLTNGASIAYELVTLSFVIDWFIDIGGYLEALNKPHGYSVSIVEYNRFTKKVQTINPNYSGNYGGSSNFQKGPTCTRDLMRYDRSSVNYPSPRIPTLEIDLNPKRVADALSLLAGAYTRVMRRFS